ncbi:hypothetical protein TanjilG_11800 [Lupinus angustifolius]|uniref:BED-type domain-containing protein n=1 Tax=Lupinus angustifolius TaxID=3871 RepID=A0A4P1R663_LUPAN|nr:hypothetical protein TanjilG_11800 [Lupinus angustifolius]
MTSSASSPNITQALAPSTQSVRAKSDPTWDYCQLLQDAEGKRTIKYLYCSKCYKGGGIHRIKQHLAGEKGDVLPCLSVPFDVKHRLREHLNQVSGSRKRGTNQNQGEEDPYEENVVQREGNMITPIPTKGLQPRVKEQKHQIKDQIIVSTISMPQELLQELNPQLEWALQVKMLFIRLIWQLLDSFMIVAFHLIVQIHFTINL